MFKLKNYFLLEKKNEFFKSNFTNIFPDKTELNLEATKSPENYKKPFSMITIQNYFDEKTKLFSNQPNKKKFILSKKTLNYFGENISFASIPSPLHVNL